MTLTDYLLDTYVEVGEDDAESLGWTPTGQHVFEVNPPDSGDIPATLDRFVKNILEIQSKWFGLKNVSPVTAFEVRRPQTDRLKYQVAVPSKRLERKIRTHLSEEIPDIGFDKGVSGLPLMEGDTVGGGLLTLGRDDFHPLQTDHREPPANSVAVALHRHAMRDTRFVVQVLFQPIAGHPIRRWRWNRRAYKQVGYLKKEKPQTIPGHERPATEQEKNQADQIEQKARNTRFKASIRILVIGAGDNTRSRVKELSGAFGVFEDELSNQYLDTYTVKSVFPSRIFHFADAVRRRAMDSWTMPFHVSPSELAALVSIPDRKQKNIRYSKP